MRRKKVYGQSQDTLCAFCGKQATVRNAQRIPVCAAHTKESLDDVRCLCGKLCEIRIGKYGPFALCLSCGPQNLDKLR